MKKSDRRIKRIQISKNRRTKPYIYSYEVSEAAKELGIPSNILQTYINENINDIKREEN